MALATDETGKTYGSLTVISLVKRGSSAWHCVCVCGKQLIVTGEQLRKGRTTSCGCQAKLAEPIARGLARRGRGA